MPPHSRSVAPAIALAIRPHSAVALPPTRHYANNVPSPTAHRRIDVRAVGSGARLPPGGFAAGFRLVWAFGIGICSCREPKRVQTEGPALLFIPSIVNKLPDIAIRPHP